MADPSTDLQTLASSHNITYEAEEAFLGSQHWRWNASSASEDDISEFFLQARESEYINKEQSGLSYLPNSPFTPDGKLRIPVAS